MKKSCVLCKSLGRPLIVLPSRMSFREKDVGYEERDQREGRGHGALRTKHFFFFIF